MKLEWLVFILAVCNAERLSSRRRGPPRARSSRGDTYLSTSISDEFIPPKPRRPSKNYLPPLEKINIAINDIPYSAPDYSHDSYFIPPAEIKQYDFAPEVKESPHQYYLPSDVFRYQVEPQVEQKTTSEQYLQPYDLKQHQEYFADPNQYYAQISEPNKMSSNNEPNTNDIIQTEQSTPQTVDRSDWKAIEYSTHSPITTDSNSTEQIVQQYDVHYPPSSEEVVAILPQNRHLTLPEAERRYDQYQRSNNNFTTPYTSQYQQQQDNNIQNTQSHQQFNNYQQQYNNAQNEVQIGNTNYNNNAQWMNNEVYSAPATQYTNQFNKPAETNQPIQYGERIIPPPPLYASSRSSNPLNPLNNTEKASETTIIPQHVKYIPSQSPSQFKSQPVEASSNKYQQSGLQQHQATIQHYQSIVPQNQPIKPQNQPIVQQNQQIVHPYAQQQPQYQPHPQTYTRNFEPQYISGPTTEAIPILKQTSDMALDGSYTYETLTGDQTHIMQHGHIENLGTDHEEQVMQGSYSFIGGDGKTYTVNYIADANGFRASGDHLPTAPPVPDVIQRSIEFNMAEEAAKAALEPPPSYQYPRYAQAINNIQSYPIQQHAKERMFNTNNLQNYNQYQVTEEYPTQHQQQQQQQQIPINHQARQQFVNNNNIQTYPSQEQAIHNNIVKNYPPQPVNNNNIQNFTPQEQALNNNNPQNYPQQAINNNNVQNYAPQEQAPNNNNPQYYPQTVANNNNSESYPAQEQPKDKAFYSNNNVPSYPNQDQANEQMFNGYQY